MFATYLRNFSSKFPRPHLVKITSSSSTPTKTCFAKRFCSSVDNSTQPDSVKKWSKLYHFSYVHHVAVLSKIKIYQAPIAVIGTPAVFGLEFFKVAPEGMTLFVGLMGFGGLAMMSLYSALASNIIGIIYVDDTNEQLKIAHLDFWGIRRQFDINISDIGDPQDFRALGPITFIHLKLKKEEKSFKLLPNHGDIYDPDLFSRIFEDTKES